MTEFKTSHKRANLIQEYPEDPLWSMHSQSFLSLFSCTCSELENHNHKWKTIRILSKYDTERT